MDTPQKAIPPCPETSSLLSKKVRGVPFPVVLLMAAGVFLSCGWLGYRQLYPADSEGTHAPGYFQDFSSISVALVMYQINTGDLPTQAQGLQALIERPIDLPPDKEWTKLMTNIPVDPWGNSYGYVRDDRLLGGFGICSKGRDGIDGTEDDLATWLPEKRPHRGF